MLESENKLIDLKSDLKIRIIVAAVNFFTTNGIKSVTMDDIASDLGISKRTLYEIFKDKESLLLECVYFQAEEKEKIEAKVLAETDNVIQVILTLYKIYIEAFHKISKKFFEDINKYPNVNEFLKNKRERNRTSVLDFFNKGVEQGLFREDINFEIVYSLLHEQTEFLISTDVFKSYPLVEVYELILFTFLRGISTDKGQLMLEEFIKEYKT